MSNRKVIGKDHAEFLKPGDNVRFKHRGFVIEGEIEIVEDSPMHSGNVRLRTAETDWTDFFSIPKNLPVEILEPEQPEEPTAFGACVEVAGVHATLDSDGLWTMNRQRLNGDVFVHWEDLCALGTVKIINADPFNTGE